MMADLERLHDELFTAWQLASAISSIIGDIMLEQHVASR